MCIFTRSSFQEGVATWGSEGLHQSRRRRHRRPGRRAPAQIIARRRGAGDPAAGTDVYEPEKIVGQRMAKGGVTQYHVKWGDLQKSAKDSTLEHSLFAAFNTD